MNRFSLPFVLLFCAFLCAALIGCKSSPTDDKLVNQWYAQLDHEDPLIRKQSYKSLYARLARNEHHLHGRVKLLLNALQDRDPSIRTYALTRLRGESLPNGLRNEALRKIVRQLGHAEDRVRDRAISALRAYGRRSGNICLAALQNALRERDPRASVAIAEILGAVPSPESQKMLLDLLGRDRRLVRIHAIDSLVEHEQKAVHLIPVLDRLATSDVDFRVREKARKAIKRLLYYATRAGSLQNAARTIVAQLVSQLAAKRMPRDYALAVCDVVEFHTEKRGPIGKRIEDAVAGELLKQTAYTIVDMHKRDRILKEMERQASLYLDQQNRAEFGQLVGAKALILGTHHMVRRDFWLISLQVTDVEKGKLWAKTSVQAYIATPRQVRARPGQ